MQVSCAFDARMESAGPASRRDSNHDRFVSWDTRLGANREPKSAIRLDKSLFRALGLRVLRERFADPVTRQAALALSKTAVFASISMKSEHQRSRHLWGQLDRHRTLVRESYWYYWPFDPLVASSVRYVDRPQPATHPVKLPGRDRHARTS